MMQTYYRIAAYKRDDVFCSGNVVAIYEKKQVMIWSVMKLIFKLYTINIIFSK